MLSADFLQIPPFPGARVSAFDSFEKDQVGKPGDLGPLISLLRKHRVGGTYWGYQPSLPPRYAVAECTTPEVGDIRQFRWPRTICDPWHLLQRARHFTAERLSERTAIAAALGVEVRLIDPATGETRNADEAAFVDLRTRLTIGRLRNPFDGTPLSLADCIALCGFWRTLIDSNRDLAGGLGFAFWKRSNVAPLLWKGGQAFEFANALTKLPSTGSVAIWRSKTPTDALVALRSSGRATIEVEDGFLRSRGLGADCIPPLSIIADRRGVYFDPSQTSDLEQILQRGGFSSTMVDRARRLRKIIVSAGLGKYERSGAKLDRIAGTRRHVLVPGQVENDRSVMEGGGGIASNLDLLRRVREAEPEAFILYKPHPDVLAGHRPGAIAEGAVRGLADAIVRDETIASLLDMVDAVHVNTSLTGFEALLRGKEVVTWGVPFYAGWGLTDDRGQVPARRTARRTLDELVAATLLVYPRYLDPITGLPCPPEVVVQRLTAGDLPPPGVVVRLRRWQGIIARQWQRLTG